MISYTHKIRIKLFLFVSACLIGLVSIFIINKLVSKVEEDERQKVMLWADAVQRKSHLVEYTNDLFEKLKEDERRKAEIWSSAMHRLSDENSEGDLTFLVKIISSNKNIPSILTDKYGNVVSSININFPLTIGQPLPDSIKKEFTKYDPIPVSFQGQTISYLFYTDSKLFVELQTIMNDYIKSFVAEVVLNSSSVPVIITDKSKHIILGYGNLDSITTSNPELMQQRIAEMEYDKHFISINNGNNLIFYEDSYLLKVLKYYPFLFFIIVTIYILISYFAFTSSRKSEQNLLWVGMSKETAHQLGTPISSLMAWVEILKLQNVDPEITDEINKDTERLNIIADRFSKIGSDPKLKDENISTIIKHATDYLKTRTGSTIKFTSILPHNPVIVPLNKALFEWVIENLYKNAVDAIEKNGTIELVVTEHHKMIHIDISDTGKGIARRKLKTIFKPGYTTKKRGWGLGLTLSKRIIEEYHKGKIFVKSSELNKGTTFRITLQKNNH